MNDSAAQDKTPAEPVVASPDETKAPEENTEVAPDQVSDDSPGVDDSAPSENEEDNES